MRTQSTINKSDTQAVRPNNVDDASHPAIRETTPVDFADNFAAVFADFPPRPGRRPRAAGWQRVVELIVSGQITTAEGARLIGRSRQQVHKWLRGHPDIQAPWFEHNGRQIYRDDVLGAREKYIKQLWENGP